MRIRSLTLLPGLLLVTPLLAQSLAGGANSDPRSANATMVSSQARELPRRAGPLGIGIDQQAKDRVLVSEVVPGGTAAAAGVAAGDTLAAIRGRSVPSMDTLRAAMREVFAGDTITIDVVRDGKRVSLPVTVAQRREAVEGSTVLYRSVTVPQGYRLRSIITLPERSGRARAGRHPALLYVQGITCDSIDRPGAPVAADIQIVHSLAKQGFVTMRVDKAGLGDSEGPPCSDIGFSEERDGYLAALKALMLMPEVDPARIYLFGYSMGGVMAPYLAQEGRVRGSIVYGTLVRTWFEYQLENARRQSELSGLSPGQVSEAVLHQAKESSMILIDKKTLGDVWRRWPEMRQEPQGLMYSENHIATRSMKFFHELQDLNLARAWQESTGSVLALYGEYDWVSALVDHQKIAEIVNLRSPGAGTVITIPQLDHGFTRHATLKDSFGALGRGARVPELSDQILRWIEAIEAPSAESPSRATPK